MHAIALRTICMASSLSTLLKLMSLLLQASLTDHTHRVAAGTCWIASESGSANATARNWTVTVTESHPMRTAVLRLRSAIGFLKTQTVADRLCAARDGREARAYCWKLVT